MTGCARLTAVQSLPDNLRALAARVDASRIAYVTGGHHISGGVEGHAAGGFSDLWEPGLL